MKQRTRTAGASARPQPKVTQWRVICSEWGKLLSVRSTKWTMVISLTLIIGFGIAISAIFSAQWNSLSQAQQMSYDPLDIGLGGIGLAQLSISVLGVLAISSEYSTGMIRADFLAVPKRLPILWGKALAFSGLVLAATIPSVLIAFFASQKILSAHGSYSIEDTHALRVIVGSILFLPLIGVFSLAVAAIIRSTAGSIATLFGLFFVGPPVLSLLPGDLGEIIPKFFPGDAAASMYSSHISGNALSPIWGGLVLCGYICISLTIAAILLLRRDA